MHKHSQHEVHAKFGTSYSCCRWRSLPHSLSEVRARACNVDNCTVSPVSRTTVHLSSSAGLVIHTNNQGCTIKCQKFFDLWNFFSLLLLFWCCQQCTTGCTFFFVARALRALATAAIDGTAAFFLFFCERFLLASKPLCALYDETP